VLENGVVVGRSAKESPAKKAGPSVRMKRRSRSSGLSFSPPNKPPDAATNQEDRKTCTYERAWSATIASPAVTASPLTITITRSRERWNAQCQ
jgi:hypothetical protein